MAANMNWLQEWLEENARNGKFNVNTRLFKDEAEQIREEWGVAITLMATEPDKNGYYLFNVSWRYALDSKRLKQEEKAYIEGRTCKFPKVESYAQRLFLISLRAKNK